MSQYTLLKDNLASISHDSNATTEQDETTLDATSNRRSLNCRDALAHTLLFTILILVQSLLCLLLLANIYISTSTSILPFLRQQPARPAFENSVSYLFNLTLPTIQTQYGSDISYMSLDSSLNWLWAADSDPYAGLVQLDPPNTDGSIRWGEIAMYVVHLSPQQPMSSTPSLTLPNESLMCVRHRFHQLHCLSSLRTALQRATRNESIGMDFHDDKHWPHCLHYLRQAILCYADDTVELPTSWDIVVDSGTANGDGISQVTSKRVGAIDGADDLRVCRKVDDLKRVVVERGHGGSLSVSTFDAKSLAKLDAGKRK